MRLVASWDSLPYSDGKTLADYGMYAPVGQRYFTGLVSDAWSWRTTKHTVGLDCLVPWHLSSCYVRLGSISHTPRA